MRDVDAENDVHAWEKKAVHALLGVLSVCFVAWAGVVWNSGQNVVNEMRAARLEEAQFRLLMERRLTVAEQQLVILQQRQAWVIDHVLEKEGRDVPP